MSDVKKGLFFEKTSQKSESIVSCFIENGGFFYGMEVDDAH